MHIQSLATLAPLVAVAGSLFAYSAAGVKIVHPVISPGLGLGEACQKDGVSCVNAGPGIIVTGQGLAASAPTLQGYRWYLGAPEGASGKAEGCGNSTIYFDFNDKFRAYHGEPNTKGTENDCIKAWFDSDPFKVVVKEYMSTTAPGADLYLECIL